MASSAAMLCAICNQFQGRWPIDSWAEYEKNRGRGTRSLIVPDTPWEHVTASAQHCYGCKIIVDGCRVVFQQHHVQESDVVNGSIRFFYPSHTEDVGTADCDKHLVFQLAAGRRFEIELFVTEDDDCPVPDAWDYMPTMDRTSPRTDSAKAMATINDWITECAEDGTDYLCDTFEPSELPKRVIDVGVDDAAVRLVEPNGKLDRYICLSHCWGLEQIITTTRATLDDRKGGITWSDLSQTFQDAITLTRRLGFQYIWIDSLCIIQDSAEDWQLESARMASIYSNGFLTIAGTKSPNGRGGLFTSTPDYCVSGLTPDGEEYCVYFRERIDHQIDNILESARMTSSTTYYPLLSRAWVYQERMLSTRVLHFGWYEAFFECKSMVRCECGAISYHGTGTETPVSLIKVEYADALMGYSQGYEGRALKSILYQGARLWRTMVCSYTTLSLTKSKDRLPAFGGLARQMASQRKSRYLAGLWEDSLNDDLLWNIWTTSKLKSPRPEPRNAPTWSWASVESAAGVDYLDTILYTDLESNGIEERSPYTHYSRISVCEVTESAVDEFGPLSHGTLLIEGLVVEGVLGSKLRTYDGQESIQHLVSFGDRVLPMDSDYLLDEEGPNKTSSGTTVFCLRMSMLQQSQNKDCLMSLVLRNFPKDPSVFERIGTLKITGARNTIHPDSTIFHGAESRLLTIF
jgi:hypothetical protein